MQNQRKAGSYIFSLRELSSLLTLKNTNYILKNFIFMLSHHFILCISALFTKENYVLTHYKNQCISLCSLNHPWKSMGTLLLFYCDGVQLKIQIRADQSEALKPKLSYPIRGSKTEATVGSVTPSHNKPPITSYFSDWISILIHTHRVGVIFWGS